MSDPRFQSLHLEGQPRRDLFRAAREQLRAGVGTNTLAGDLGLLASDQPAGDGPTIAIQPGGGVPAAGPLACFLRDGPDVHCLHVGVNSVGRLTDNDVVIRDDHVSRRHCAIVVHSDFRCDLHDVASKNGTWLNGRKIAGPTRLHPGDQIILCGRRLTFVMSEPGAVAG